MASWTSNQAWSKYLDAVHTVNSNSRTSNCQCNLFSIKKNPIIRICCIFERLAVPIEPDKWSSTFQLCGNTTRRSKTYKNWTLRAKPAGLVRRPVLTTFSITRWHYDPAPRSSAAVRTEKPNPRGWCVRVNGAIVCSTCNDNAWLAKFCTPVPSVCAALWSWQCQKFRGWPVSIVRDTTTASYDVTFDLLAIGRTLRNRQKKTPYTETTSSLTWYRRLNGIEFLKRVLKILSSKTYIPWIWLIDNLCKGMNEILTPFSVFFFHLE
jgi:hypothetical protein